MGTLNTMSLFSGHGIANGRFNKANMHSATKAFSTMNRNMKVSIMNMMDGRPRATGVLTTNFGAYFSAIASPAPKPRSTNKITSTITAATPIVSSGTPIHLSDTLRKHSVTARVKTKQRDTCLAHILHIEDFLETTECELHVMSVAYDNAVDVNAKLGAENAELHKLNESFRHEAVEKDKAMDKLKELLAKERFDNQCVEDKLCKALEGQRKMTKDYHGKWKDVKRTNNMFRTSVNEHAKELCRVVDINYELSEKVGNLEEEISKQKNDIEKWKRQQGKILKERGEFRKQAESYEQKNEQMEQQIDELRQNHHQFVTTVNENWTEAQRGVEKWKTSDRLKEVELVEAHNRNKATIAGQEKEIGLLEKQINLLRRAPFQLGNTNAQAIINETLRREVKAHQETIRLQKKDIQNLAIEQQEHNNQNNKLFQQANAAREECAQTQEKLAQAEGKLYRSQALVSQLEARSNETTIDFSEHLAQVDFNLPAIAEFMSVTIGNEVVKGLLKANAENEGLREQLDALESEQRKLQDRYNDVENQLDKYIMDEQFHEVNLRHARVEVDNLRTESKNCKDLIRQYSDALALYQGILGVSDWTIYRRQMLNDYERKCEELECIVQRYLPGLKKLEDDKATCEKELRELKLNHGQSLRSIKFWEDLYFDKAVCENERLHQQLAHYMSKCGKSHNPPPQVPRNKLVHERRILGDMFQYGLNGIDPKYIPPEARDPDFIAGLVPAVAVAMKKIMPQLWELHLYNEKAYVAPTVPILTEVGPLDGIQDSEGTSVRVAAVLRELQDIHDADPTYEESELDSEDDNTETINYEMERDSNDDSSGSNSDSNSVGSDDSDTDSYHDSDGEATSRGAASGEGTAMSILAGNTRPDEWDENFEYQPMFEGDGMPAFYHKRNAEIDAKLEAMVGC